ncbi:peptide-methionine (S)-S-oxide reductase MsrA [Sphingomonas sp. Leaf357]|uniref:peptide-methionine (S)-S-oxide reductase MsrA n=1 Tax=Sphingomonas sp. Leaf357 TaxID=1736350 RepID=UPI003FA70D45
MQDLIRKLPGVVSTRVGYSGGELPNATYRNHGNHAEAIETVFDPARTDFRALLEFFFQIHDPTTVNRQGNDRGSSYRSAIFYTDDVQKAVAEETISDVDASGLWPGKVVTELSPAGDFWEAEPEHQDYLERRPNGTRVTSSGRSGNCHGVRPLSGTKPPQPDCKLTQASLIAAVGTHKATFRSAPPFTDIGSSFILSRQDLRRASQLPSADA